MIRRVLLVTGYLLEAELRAQGLEVTVVAPESGIVDLPGLCAERGLVPDLIIHRELLAPRTLLAGLESFDCPKIFWSLDTHLNAWWQGFYGRLFDVTFCTQKDWMAVLSAMGAHGVELLPWPGFDRPFTPHAGRLRDIGFAGRLTASRPVRRYFAKFLRDLGAYIAPEMPHGQMMDYLAGTRIVPNETILGEVNWRLFEAASLGCLTLHPGFGNGLADHFEPGREVIVYGDALDLRDKLAYYRAHPDQAEAVARAGYARVRAGHLQEHRAGRVLAAAGSAAARADKGERAGAALALAAAGLYQAGNVRLGLGEVLARLQAHQDDPACLDAAIRCLAVSGDFEKAKVLALALLPVNQHPDNLALNLTGSVLCLAQGLFDAAKAFWYRQTRADGDGHAVKPESPAVLYRLWGQRLLRANILWRPGFPFDENATLPATATECLMLSRARDPADLHTLKRLEIVLRELPGSEYARLGCLAELTLREPGNWRHEALLALLDLTVFRVAEGLSGLDLARAKAARQGEADKFERFRRAAAGTAPGH